MHFFSSPEYTRAIRIATFLAILGAVSFVGPRTGEAQSIRYGVKGGLSLSTVASEFPNADIDLDLKRHRGLSLLAFGEWRATSVFSLLGEMGYAQRGYRETAEKRNEENERIGTVNHITSFGYASTTILVKARYSAPYSPYLLAGPHLGVLLHSSYDGPDTDKSETTVTEQYDSVTVGGTVGVGVETDRLLSGTTTFLEVRFGADGTDSLSDLPREIRNRTLDVILGIAF